MKKIIICLLLVFSLLLITGCKKENKPLEVVKSDLQDGNKFNVYLENNDRIIYLSSSLKEVYYYDGSKMRLKEYIKKTWQTMDDSIKHITDLLTLENTIKDGGTKIYSSMEYDMKLIECNRINYKRDIYIGDYNLDYDINLICNR